MGISVERKSFLGRLLCKHAFVIFVRNIHGDEINQYGGKRSIWKCCFCGKYKLDGKLYIPKDTNPLYKVL